MDLRNGLVQEAARLICEEQLTDYRTAKLKAAQRLGLGPKAALPDNAAVQEAVLDYLRLFGGRAYRERLLRLRRDAVAAMKLLAPFDPRLVGAVVSGALNEAHRIQLHAFSERAESIEIFLQDRGIACEQGERSYRYPDGRELRVPLVCFDSADAGIDVATFDPHALRNAPLNPADGRAYQRLDLAAAQALAAQPG